MHYADAAVVVTNPEVSSVRDSDRILGMLSSKTQRAIDGREPVKEHLLITRYNPNRVEGGQMLSLGDIVGRNPKERIFARDLLAELQRRVAAAAGGMGQALAPPEATEPHATEVQHMQGRLADMRADLAD